MITKVVRAKFKGPEPSLGYEPGQIYTLAMGEATLLDRITNGWPQNYRIIVRAPYFCPYSTYWNFNKNWEVLDAEHETTKER